MRRTALIAVFAAGAAAAVVPALAADKTVDATSDNKFKPATVTVSIGDQVTFRNNVAGGYHNVHFADGPGNAPRLGPWTYSRRFTKSGHYPYVCDIHVSAGMTGEVVVLGADGSVPPPASPPPGPSPPPSPAAPPGSAPRFSVRAVRTRFCARGCARPGIVLRVSLSERATVAGPLERRSRAGTWRADGRVRFGAGKGKHTITVAKRTDGRRIGPGVYRLALRAHAAGGGSSPRRVLRFSVR